MLFDIQRAENGPLPAHLALQVRASPTQIGNTLPNFVFNNTRRERRNRVSRLCLRARLLSLARISRKHQSASAALHNRTDRYRGLRRPSALSVVGRGHARPPLRVHGVVAMTRPMRPLPLLHRFHYWSSRRIPPIPKNTGDDKRPQPKLGPVRSGEPHGVKGVQAQRDAPKLS